MSDNGKEGNHEIAFECTGCPEKFTMQDIIARDIVQHCDKCGAKIKVYSAPKTQKETEATQQVNAQFLPKLKPCINRQKGFFYIKFDKFLNIV